MYIFLKRQELGKNVNDSSLSRCIGILRSIWSR